MDVAADGARARLRKIYAEGVREDGGARWVGAARR